MPIFVASLANRTHRIHAGAHCAAHHRTGDGHLHRHRYLDFSQLAAAFVHFHCVSGPIAIDHLRRSRICRLVAIQTRAVCAAYRHRRDEGGALVYKQQPFGGQTARIAGRRQQVHCGVAQSDLVYRHHFDSADCDHLRRRQGCLYLSVAMPAKSNRADQKVRARHGRVSAQYPHLHLHARRGAISARRPTQSGTVSVLCH
mmetsp:Transcript_7771/g.12739  ORF Transcript_7771/g.12739 Transcript_7771/m.12739 type:complete len:200 (+) Transcript_7771:382-981(+)